MKNHLVTLALVGTLLTLGEAAQSQTVQTINGWGHDNDSINGTTITDSGSLGNFSVSGLPSGSSDFRADLPTAVTLSVGETLTISGSFSLTGGSMGGGVFRIGILDYSSLGILSGTTWNVGSTATGYWYGPSTGSTQQGNPGGGSDIVRKPTTAANAWYSGSGGAAVGTTPSNANNIDASGGVAGVATYTFSLSLLDTISGISVNYSLLGDNSPIYTASGTVTDASGTVPSTFNAVGFFANGSDSAFTSGVNFTGVTETVTAVPEPASMTLLGLGALVGTFVIRRKK